MAGVKISALTAFTPLTASKNADVLPVVNFGAPTPEEQTQKPTIYDFFSTYFPRGLWIRQAIDGGVMRPIETFDENHQIPLYASTEYIAVETRLRVGSDDNPEATIDIFGEGATAATKNFRARNSAGTELMAIKDDGSVTFGSSGQASFNNSGILTMDRWQGTTNFGGNYLLWSVSDLRMAFSNTQNARFTFNNYCFGDVTPTAASAMIEIKSTSAGMLFSRMTTVQKNAVATPVAGLCVYDTTLGKLCIYTGAAWETITSV
jgi:hypothetical protein